MNSEMMPPAIDETGDQRGVLRLKLHLVGELRAELPDGRSVLPVSRKARALLALVAAQSPQSIRRDAAASMLWSNKLKAHAANSLRQALRDLQLALSPCGPAPILLATSGRLALDVNVAWIDLYDGSAMKQRFAADQAMGSMPLCRDLQGTDPAFDAYLAKLWKDLVFKQAFTPLKDLAGGLSQRPPFIAVAHDGDELVGHREASAVASIERAGGPPTQADGEPVQGRGRGWRMAVLPFRSLGPLLQGSFSLGMAEEISSALARFRMPRLIATSSFWDGSGPAKDSLERCRAYNLDYVISGTIQTSGKRVRVTVTLLDIGMDFEVVWASRFDGSTDDLFTLLDTIASQTVAQIDPELLQRHQFVGNAPRTANAAAHQAVLAAIQGIYGPDKARFLQARDLLGQAIELDGRYAAAHAWLAYWNIIAVGQGWIDDTSKPVEDARIAAERAILLDPLDARGLAIAGHVKAYLLHDLNAANALHQRAVSLNPNLPVAWTLSSCASIYNGNHQRAVEEARMAITLSPGDPHVFFPEHALMMAYFFLRELDVAETQSSLVLERKPNHASALRIRLAILGHLRRTQEARACLRQLRQIEPEVTARSIVSRPPLRPDDVEYYIKGLRLAGLSD